MNYSLFEIKGKHFETKRIRTLKIEAITEEEAVIKAKDNGLETITSIEIIPFDQPTERQIEYAHSLGIQIPVNASQKDVSALISHAVEKDGIPNQGLVDYATNKKILFSKYIGKTALYNKIFSQLSNIDRNAFFIFSIYRYISDDRHANLDTHPNKVDFYEFANSVNKDEKFLNSLKKYSGASLKYFGEFTVEGITHTGGSVNTIAFKTAREFLINKNLIDSTAPYKMKTLRYAYSYNEQLEAPIEEINTVRRKQYTKDELKQLGAIGGCLGILIIIFYQVFFS
nr:hypothetical protein [Lysinibacillus sphaericus]